MIPIQAITAEDTSDRDTHQSKVGQFLGDGEQSYTLERRRPRENPSRDSSVRACQAVQS